MKCCVCNNSKSGEFITVNDKKYHLCCIEELQQKINKAIDFTEKQKKKMYKSRNKIAMFILMKLEKILKDCVIL